MSQFGKAKLSTGNRLESQIENLRAEVNVNLTSQSESAGCTSPQTSTTIRVTDDNRPAIQVSSAVSELSNCNSPGVSSVSDSHTSRCNNVNDSSTSRYNDVIATPLGTTM